MMGVGKSTIGKCLAKMLSYDFADIDLIIENKEKNSINSIFKNKSESYFRKIENDISLSILKKREIVISLGGGAFMNKSIREAAKSSSISFWLDLNLNELVKRLNKTKKRPLLFKKDLKSTINKIYLERKKTYSSADFKINCNYSKPENIADKILELYEKTRNKI